MYVTNVPESEKQLHIKTIKFSGNYDEYKREYSEFINELAAFKKFVQNYMPMRNRISNYFDENIVQKLNLYNICVLQKSTLSFDLGYEIKMIDIQFFMDAYDSDNNEILKTLSQTAKFACITGYNNAVQIYNHEQRPDVNVIKPTYTRDEISDYKRQISELFPEYSKTNSNSK